MGGLHKSMTRLSSSQQINQNGGSNAAIANNNFTSSGALSNLGTRQRKIFYPKIMFQGTLKEAETLRIM